MSTGTSETSRQRIQDRIQDPGFAARVRDSFARQAVMVHLGARLVDVGPGAAVIDLPYRPELTQQHGFFHAGMVTTIADSAAGYASFSLMPADASVLTVEFKLNTFAPADGELLRARGRVLRAGRTLIVAQADVEVLKEGETRPCAVLLGTFMTLHGRSDRAGGDHPAPAR